MPRLPNAVHTPPDFWRPELCAKLKSPLLKKAVEVVVEDKAPHLLTLQSLGEKVGAGTNVVYGQLRYSGFKGFRQFVGSAVLFGGKKISPLAAIVLQHDMSPKDAQFCEELIAGRTDRAALAKKMKVTGDSLPSYARRVSLALGFHRFLMDKQGSFSTLSMYLQVVTSQEYVDKLRREAVGVFKHT